MKLILGSKSPRRKELLKELGFEFEIRTKEIDESFPEQLRVEEVASFIATKKAEALMSSLENNEVLICSDTVVTIDNCILGKPDSKEHAIQMLSQLSGRTHQVITGVYIASLEKNMAFSVQTNVQFHPLSGSMIKYYVDTYQPMDKAGAYGIQEWIGHVAIKRIEGSYNNVVGLPTHETYLALQEFL
jgi:septum formation protein